ncbi:MAG: hypothetical protein H7A24_10620 [Leptospiraceae bacterium]|nr:hypothetical protein [Leptospiraceae bacterium]MCP5512324.1 hypothetical protein [Leptospiraceae bacterium]
MKKLLFITIFVLLGTMNCSNSGSSISNFNLCRNQCRTRTDLCTLIMLDSNSNRNPALGFATCMLLEQSCYMNCNYSSGSSRSSRSSSRSRSTGSRSGSSSSSSHSGGSGSHGGGH